MPETEWQAIARGCKTGFLWFLLGSALTFGFFILFSGRYGEYRLGPSDASGLLVIAAVVGAGFGLIAFLIGYYGAYSGAEIIEEEIKDTLSGGDDDPR